jgi:hypothetical protein
MQTSPLQEQRTRVIGVAISLVSALATLVVWAAPNPPWQIPALFTQDAQRISWSQPFAATIALLILAFPLTALVACVASIIEARFGRQRMVMVIHSLAVFVCAFGLVCYAIALGLVLLIVGPNSPLIPINYGPCLLFPCITGMAIGLAMLGDRQARPRFRWR